MILYLLRKFTCRSYNARYFALLISGSLATDCWTDTCTDFDICNGFTQFPSTVLTHPNIHAYSKKASFKGAFGCVRPQFFKYGWDHFFVFSQDWNQKDQGGVRTP